MTRLGYFLAAGAGALLTATSVHAADQETQVGELVVTADRRPENAIDVPISLTALSGKTLDRLDVRDLSALSSFTPGLLVQDKSATDSRFVLRGIGSDDGSSYQEPRVSVFLDGAPISKSRGAFVELFDLDRVEVARGPQTTLFGQGALIGAINIVERKADPAALDWSLGGEAGSFDYRQATGVLNVPLGSTLAIRAAGQYRARDGNVESLLDGEAFGGFEVEAGRVALAWRPSDTLFGDVVYNRQHDDGTGQPYKSASFYPADPATGTVKGDLTPYGVAALASGPKSPPLGLNRDVENWLGALTWTPDPRLTIVSTTAWRRFEGHQTLDYDGFAFPLLTVGDDTVGETFSQELRARFAPTSRFDVVTGLNFGRDQGSQRTPLMIDERLVLSLYSGGLDLRNPTLKPLAAYIDPNVQAGLLQGLATAKGATLTGAQALGIANNLQAAHPEAYQDYAKNKSYDAYADFGFQATEKLKFNLGGRYAYVEKTSGLSASVPEGRSVLGGFIGALGQSAAARGALFNILSLPGAATNPGLPQIGIRVQPSLNNGDVETASLMDDGPAFRAAAHYKLTGDAAVYATYARGRRPKVLAPIVPSKPLATIVFNRVAAETVDSYEVGAKLRLPDPGVTLNAALYTYRYEHFQTVIQQGTQYVTADAGEAANTGLELDGTWFVAQGAKLFANYTYSHARFGEGLFKGNHLALSPDHAVTVGLDAERPVAGGTGKFLATWRYQSQTFFTDDNSNPALITGAFVAPVNFMGSQDGYGIADLRLDWSPKDEHWSAGLFAKNLFDERYVKESGNGGQDFGLPTYIAGDPRVIGVSLSVRR